MTIDPDRYLHRILVFDKRGLDYGIYSPDKEYPDKDLTYHFVVKSYPHPEGGGVRTEMRQIKPLEFVD